jgi:hypothetical protein
MSPTVAALLGSLIGAIAALAGSGVTSFVALKTEKRYEESKERISYITSLRERSGIVFAQFFIIVQEIEWVIWFGVNDPDAVNKQRIESYEDKVNNVYGTLLGAMAMTASLSLLAYEEMRPILSNLYDLEGRVGEAIRKVETERSVAIQELRDCRPKAEELRDELPPELNRIMNLAETADRHQKG